ncbi:MAG: hypothetical protein WCT18_04530 [Patescibacteria group bacterium]
MNSQGIKKIMEKLDLQCTSERELQQALLLVRTEKQTLVVGLLRELNNAKVPIIAVRKTLLDEDGLSQKRMDLCYFKRPDTKREIPVGARGIPAHWDDLAWPEILQKCKIVSVSEESFVLREESSTCYYFIFGGQKWMCITTKEVDFEE